MVPAVVMVSVSMIPMVVIPVIVMIPVVMVIIHRMILLGIRPMVLVSFTTGQKEEGRDEEQREGEAEGVTHGREHPSGVWKKT